MFKIYQVKIFYFNISAFIICKKKFLDVTKLELTQKSEAINDTFINDDSLSLSSYNDNNICITSVLDSDIVSDIDKLNYDAADTVSIETDTQTVIQCFVSGSPQTSSLSSEGTIILNTIKTNESENSRFLDPLRTQAIKKLLTEPNLRSNSVNKNNTEVPENNLLLRDVSSNRSFRVEKSKANDLDFIADRHKRVCFTIFFIKLMMLTKY